MIFTAKNKLPTPIRKARQESVRFVNQGSVLVEEETPLSKVMQEMEHATPGKSDSGKYSSNLFVYVLK